MTGRTVDKTGAEIAAMLRERCDTIYLSGNHNGSRTLHCYEEACINARRADLTTKPIDAIPPGWTTWCKACVVRALPVNAVFDSDPPAAMSIAYLDGIDIMQDPQAPLTDRSGARIEVADG